MTEEIASSIVIERIYRASLEDLWALWTTKEGFQSWWGPEGFRADVHRMEGCTGGALHYDMVADTPDMIAAMTAMGQPVSTACNGHFAEFRAPERLVLKQIIDFLPNVDAYESIIEVDFLPQPGGYVRMVVTLHQMHDARTTGMQRDGFLSQLSKLDRRYGWRL
ncbi:uncharacterized protein YndB with AHSA1/START domain [Sphingobium sp. OAS761]|uniref:SRPBCC family protein n=1 Tax=Sphingobium sp. OAS761 TaxID=2817901 RepID=UPI00209D4766|nr:SRPBCC domain-containing protein [Sphingobium sp. OAS761]MCP1471802.1 uncharacterized protein YndB with AHSA1/START domain [Sphingobium sp. OAS761]